MLHRSAHGLPFGFGFLIAIDSGRPQKYGPRTVSIAARHGTLPVEAEAPRLGVMDRLNRPLVPMPNALFSVSPPRCAE